MLIRIILTAGMISSFLFASFPGEVSAQMLYLLHRGEVQRAFQIYLDHSTEGHDFDLLQQAAIQLLKQGARSDDLEIQLMSLFGAGVANSAELIPVLEKGLLSSEMKIQLVALSYLSRLQDDEADLLLVKALSSPFLLTRLEACYQLASKNHPSILGLLQSLMVKVPTEVRPLFPQIACKIEGAQAHAYMRQLLTDNDINVRLSAILTVAQEKRDDFLIQIRDLATQAHHAIQESAALTLGELKDTQSLEILRKLLTSKRVTVRLAAAVGLYSLGEETYLTVIEEEAAQGNLFAIHILGKLRKGEDLLKKLIHHEDRDVRLNTILSLLNMRSREAKEHLKEILMCDKQDLGFIQTVSAGGGLKTWKTIPSANSHSKIYPTLKGQTRLLREEALILSLELPESDFLEIARLVFEERQYDLIPLTIAALESRKSDQVIELLKEMQQKAGVPFIRHYCTLALYRLMEEDFYEKQLIQWVEKANNQALIQFREENSIADRDSTYVLTPEETSQILIDTFETFAQTQSERGTEVLIQAIAYGNPKNRYALAGLLIRTTE
ncbi:MAG: HEAT repeat domain-containing protein [Chlamydiales bacterium]